MVLSALFSVNISVQFDHEPVLVAIVVRDVVSQLMLATEFQAH